MPITLSEVAKHLDAIGWNYTVFEDRSQIGLVFDSAHYADRDGVKQVRGLIHLEAEGQYLRVVLPAAYNLKDCKFKGSVLAVFGEVAFHTRGLQCEYDSTDGEVRYVVDSWVLDNTLTRQQLEIMVRAAFQFLEEFDPVVRHAMSTGKVDFGLAVKADEQQSDGSPAPLPPEIEELVRRAGGIEGLREAVDAWSKRSGS